MSVSIIGGGLTGCLIALELAEAGHKVVLFDRASELMARASFANEGKIHLGFVYAADTSFQTARRMIDDALRFRPLLERWIPSRVFEAMIYDRFDYFVPHSSMLSVKAINAHFGKVIQYLNVQTNRNAASYLGRRDFAPVSPSAPPHDTLQALFHTPEQGVWPASIAEEIRRCVHSHPRVDIRLDTTVTKIRPQKQQWHLDLMPSDKAEQTTEGPFETVINCAWAGRRHLDAASGHPDHAQWFYRYKFGVVLSNARAAFGGALPRNSTAMLGAYGDSVYCAAQDSLYCSWYPVGMCFSCAELVSDQPPRLDDHEAAILKTWQGYATIDPTFKTLLETQPISKARIVGDYIAAKAKTDIQDPNSRLHERHGYGAMQLAPGYWSVETGKYTSAARCAEDCVRAILEREPCSGF
ncbi:FAD-dependent oxidoreductase [Cohaesibacter intestini]|uniref:FAD-dependent oxidoreductase n=1 Tax=Cohaesibacter intestini TaxID=2211145 RepID=UPI000DE851CA|nr:FAD-dependent oxidoreductase [Cohaesibacter intestini]